MYDPASLITTGFLLPILGGIAVGLRLYCRKVNSAPILIDDYFIVVAQIVLIGMGATQLYGTFAGELGGNTEVSPEGIPIVTKRTRVVLKVQYIEEVIEKIAYGASKLSIIFFYRRIFQIKPLFNIISWTLIALTAIFTVSFTIAVAFQCKSHFSTSWSFASLSDLDTQCMNTVAELIAFSVFDVALDLAILSQPIPLIMGLQMNKRRKLTLLGIFGLGSLSIAAGVVRLAITVHEATHADDPVTLNLAKVITPPMLWSLVEIATAVIAACLPTLGPLIHDWYDKISDHYKRGRSEPLSDVQWPSSYNRNPPLKQRVSSTSNTRLVPDENDTEEAYAMSNLAYPAAKV